MVHAGLGVGLDRHGAGPDLLRSDPRVVDRRLTEHAGSLRGIGVELVAGDHPDAVVLPARPVVGVIMGMRVIIGVVMGVYDIGGLRFVQSCFVQVCILRHGATAR